MLWENVEGVLTDRTNAFGCFISLLAGLEEPLAPRKWPSSGIVYGPERNIAWRVLDAKFFGLPQQRRRLYVMAGGKDFHPENILFELHDSQNILPDFPKDSLVFEKDGCKFEVFREYTDCLYSAYGTKWNGNAAATNGSLFVVQNGRIRRLSPLETERLMGFPDNYTELAGAKKTTRYQATGNSWAVPVIKWIGSRLVKYSSLYKIEDVFSASTFNTLSIEQYHYIPLGNNCWMYGINASTQPEVSVFGKMSDIVSSDAPDDIYISPVGCYGIIRRKEERNMSINARLEVVLREISATMSAEEIETRSRVQKRGRYSE